MTGAGRRPVPGGSPAGKKRGAGKHPFLLNVHSLRSRAGNRMELNLAGEIEELSYGIPEGDDDPVIGPLPGGSAVVPEGGLVSFEGWAESTPGGVTVAGRVTAPFLGICRRCLEKAEGTLAVEVRELFLDPRERPEAFVGEETESYPVRADELDIQPMVRDACILELPLAPLCSESCAGLCPICGANRNDQACSCEPEADPRWAGLTGLYTEGSVAGENEVDEDQVRKDDGRPQEEDL